MVQSVLCTIWPDAVTNVTVCLIVFQATVLFPGVACFFLAFCAGAATHVLNEKHVTKEKLRIDRQAAPSHSTACLPMRCQRLRKISLRNMNNVA